MKIQEVANAVIGHHVVVHMSRVFLAMFLVFAVVFISHSGFYVASPAEAAINQELNYQGKLTNVSDGTNVLNGTYAFEFKMYTALTGGAAVWTETYDQPTGACANLQVTNGIFNAKLGSCSSLAGVDFSGGSMYVTVNFAPTGVAYDGEMAPRKEITGSAYAFIANSLQGNGTIDIANTDGNQARIGYDATNYLNLDVSATGLSTFTAAGTGADFNFAGGNVGIGNVSPTALLTLGTAGTTAGTLSFAGATSGTVTVQTQAAAGTYNFNLPTTAGLSGQVLTSGGGAGAPMIWSTPAGASLWSDGANGHFNNTEGIIIGADAAETIANAGFALNAGDLFVADQLGVEGLVFSDTGFVAGDATTYADGTITTSASTSGLAIDTSAATGDVVITLGENAGDDFIVDTDTLVVESDTNRVGIGTATPTDILHVQESANVGTRLLLENTNGGTLANPLIATQSDAAYGGLASLSSTYTMPHFASRTVFFQSQGSGFDIAAGTATSDIRFYTGGFDATDEQVRLTSTGNFGIGDTTPASALTVGNGDLFQVTSAGAIAAATGITSSGAITFSGLADGIVTASSGVLSGGGSVDLTSDVSGALPVANGGTGATTLTSNGVLLGNGTSAVSATAAPTAGQILVGNGSGVPTFVSTTGDAIIDSSGVIALQANVVDGTHIALGSDAQGDIMYYDGTNWVRLAAGTSGHYLQTQGGGANPQWTAVSGTGISSLNGQTLAAQTFATGTTGTDFNIVSALGAHTFNIPDASLLARGLVTTGAQTFAGIKSFSTNIDVGGMIQAGTGNINITTALGNIDADAIQLITLDGAGATSSGSGLETDTDRLGLLQGCADGQILVWDDTANVWECGSNRATYHSVLSGDYTNNTNVLTDVDDNATGLSDIAFPIGANEEWVFEFHVDATLNTTGDQRWRINAPAGASCDMAFVYTESANGESQLTCGEDTGTFGAANGPDRVTFTGYVDNGANAGTVQLQYRQRSNGGVATTIHSGSFVTAYKISGADLAEVYYATEEGVVPGTVVSIDELNQGAGVKKSTKSYQSDLAGIISTEPGHILGERNPNYEGKPVFLALAGRVPVRVNGENGSIKAGDFITSSSTSGVAMKATKAGAVIGQALEDIDFAEGEEGKVVVFVKPTTFNGVAIDSVIDGLEFDYAGLGESTASEQILDHLLAQLENLDDENLSQINTDLVIAGGEVITPTVTTNVLRANTLTSASADGGLSIASTTLLEGGLVVDSINSLSGLLSFQSDVEFFGTPYFTSDTAGFAVIKEGAKVVDIDFSREYIAQPIVNATMSFAQEVDTSGLSQPAQDAIKLAQIGSVEQILSNNVSFAVVNKSERGFSIVLSQPAPKDIEFGWAALAVKNAQTFTSIDSEQSLAEGFIEGSEEPVSEEDMVIEDEQNEQTTEPDEVVVVEENNDSGVE